MNYDDLNSKNRFLIKNSIRDSNGKNLTGCMRTLLRNPSFSVDLNEAIWELVASTDPSNTVSNNEYYKLVFLTDKTSSNLRPFWNYVKFPYIDVKLNILFQKIQVSLRFS